MAVIKINQISTDFLLYAVFANRVKTSLCGFHHADGIKIKLTRLFFWCNLKFFQRQKSRCATFSRWVSSLFLASKVLQNRAKTAIKWAKRFQYLWAYKQIFFLYLHEIGGAFTHNPSLIFSYQPFFGVFVDVLFISFFPLKAGDCDMNQKF